MCLKLYNYTIPLVSNLYSKAQSDRVVTVGLSFRDDETGEDIIEDILRDINHIGLFLARSEILLGCFKFQSLSIRFSSNYVNLNQ